MAALITPQAVALALAVLLLAGCSDQGAPDDELNPARAPEIPRLVPASEAVAEAEIAKLDPAKMTAAEIEKGLGAGPRCEFRYASFAEPVLALKTGPDGAEASGVVKLNGKLVTLQSVARDDGAVDLRADPVHIVLTPERGRDGGSSGPGERQEARLIFEVNDSLRAGYRGYYSCVE